MFFNKTQDFSLGHIFPGSEFVLDKLENGFFLGFVKSKRAVGVFAVFLLWNGLSTSGGE
jgi:hypothetical protein